MRVVPRIVIGAAVDRIGDKLFSRLPQLGLARFLPELDKERSGEGVIVQHDRIDLPQDIGDGALCSVIVQNRHILQQKPGDRAGAIEIQNVPRHPVSVHEGFADEYGDYDIRLEQVLEKDGVLPDEVISPAGIRPVRARVVEQPSEERDSFMEIL